MTDPAEGFEAAVALLAEATATCETPGIPNDELTDKLIGLARRWIDRERRSRPWLRESA